MWAVEVVVVLPFLEAGVVDVDVVDDDTVEQAVELLSVDAVAAFDLAIQPRGGGLDVSVVDALSSTCQWNADWNSAPLSVWIVSTAKGSWEST